MIMIISIPFIHLFVCYSLTYFLGQFTLDAGKFGEEFKQGASALALTSNIAFLLVVFWVGLPLYAQSCQRCLSRRAHRKAAKAALRAKAAPDKARDTSLESLQDGELHSIEMVNLPCDRKAPIDVSISYHRGHLSQKSQDTTLRLVTGELSTV